MSRKPKIEAVANGDAEKIAAAVNAQEEADWLNKPLERDTDKEFRMAYPLIRLDGKELKGRLKKLKSFISTDETRYYLNGIYIKYEEGKITFCATNGHILQEQVFDVETELSEDLEPFAVILPRMAVDHLIKVMPTKKEFSFLTMQVIDNGKNIRFDFFSFEYITATVDGTFPDYHNIMPKGDVRLREGLNAGYLISTLKALNNSAVDICVDKPDNLEQQPHLLTSSEVEGIRCVIMPMRI